MLAYGPCARARACVCVVCAFASTGCFENCPCLDYPPMYLHKRARLLEVATPNERTPKTPISVFLSIYEAPISRSRRKIESLLRFPSSRNWNLCVDLTYFMYRSFCLEMDRRRCKSRMRVLRSCDRRSAVCTFSYRSSLSALARALAVVRSRSRWTNPTISLGLA